MEKLNKEEIFNKWVHEGSIEEINEFNRLHCSERVEIAYKKGLEYSEQHYIKIIEEKNKKINDLIVELNQFSKTTEIYEKNWKNH